MVATQSDIGELKDRARTLEGRIKALDSQLDNATRNQEAARTRLEEAKAGLTVGSTKPDFLNVCRRGLEDADSIVENLTEALDSVKTELAECTSAIRAHDNREEKRRQEEIASTIRERADDALSEFCASFLEVRKKGVVYGELCRELAETCPLVDPFPALTLEVIARGVQEQLEDPMERQPQYLGEWEPWVRRVLFGPGTFNESRARFIRDANIHWAGGPSR